MIKGSILIKPILTEKMHNLQDHLNTYAFKVLTNANKLEIKKAVEDKFDVKVKHVRTINVKGKMRSLSVRSGGRVIRTQGQKANWKKALVTLMPDNNIDFYGTEIS